MAKSEQEFIDLCKKQIERKFLFGTGNEVTQRDLEVLSAHIEEKTGTNISLSTLKRLWRNNYKQRPQLATLNALAAILDFRDWQSFKSAHARKRTSLAKMLQWTVPGLLLAIVLLSIFGSSSESEKADKDRSKKIKITGPIRFEASKTVTRGIPNTVVFSYDVSHVVADSFYIQQSWDPGNKVAIDPKGNALTSIYYESGYHRARLMANDSIIAQRPIHILSEGWEPHLYYEEKDQPINLKDESFIANGQLHLDKAVLEKYNIDPSKEFYSRISNSQIFDAHSDNFSLYTRLKVDGVRKGLCPWVSVIIVTEVHIFRVTLMDKGCEKYAGYKLGEISKGGHDNDLSALGCTITDWQDLEIRVKGKHAQIYLNDTLTYEETFHKDLGRITALVYAFDGTGSIAHTKLANGNEQTVFEDNFER